MAAAIGLAGTPANADAGWNVSPEGSYAAISTDSRLINGSGMLQCAMVIASGHVASSTDSQVGTVTDNAWSNCSATFGFVFSVQPAGTWTIHALGINSSGWVDVEIRSVNATISSPLCYATVTGSVRGTYDNAGTLRLYEPPGGNLVISSASCLGRLNPGDRPGYSATFTVSPDLTITPA